MPGSGDQGRAYFQVDDPVVLSGRTVRGTAAALEQTASIIEGYATAFDRVMVKLDEADEVGEPIADDDVARFVRRHTATLTAQLGELAAGLRESARDGYETPPAS